MAGKQVQRRRGSTAQHAVFTGAVGEVTVDTDKKVEVVHDGVTPGGFPQASARDLSTTNTNVTAAQNRADAAYALADTANTAAGTAASAAAAADSKAVQAQNEVNALETVVATNYGHTVYQDNATGAATLPKGNTAQRPASATDGMIRYNSQLQRFEGLVNGVWSPVGGGDSFPLFSVLWWPNRASVPAGFVLADGQLLNRATYPDAWAGIQANNVPNTPDATWLATPNQRGMYTPGDGSSTFRMPDYNGKYSGSLGACFLRGDGTMSAASNGLIQADALQAHDHYNYFDGSVAINKAGTIGGTGNASFTIINGTGQGSLTSGVRAPARSNADETRPLNVTGCWVVKLFGAVINPGAADAAQLASDVANLQANKAGLNTSNTYVGSGLRFRAQLTGTPHSTRYMFQTSQVDNNSWVNVLPNGAGQVAGFHAYSKGTDPDNGLYARMYTNSANAIFESGGIGSQASVYPQLVLQQNGRPAMLVTANGNTILHSTISGAGHGYLTLASGDGAYSRAFRVTSANNLELLNSAQTVVTHTFYESGSILLNGILSSANGTSGGHAQLYRTKDGDGNILAWMRETERNMGVHLAYLPSAPLAGFMPSTDNGLLCGWALGRWAAVFAVNGTIQTSDARLKTPLRAFTAGELACAQELAAQYGFYQWLEKVAVEGEAARQHCGITAQYLIERFEAHGLQPMSYGIICLDAWNDIPEQVDEDGLVIREAIPAGDRYSIRYEQLANFVLRGVAENQRLLEARLAALEAALAPINTPRP